METVTEIGSFPSMVDCQAPSQFGRAPPLNDEGFSLDSQVSVQSSPTYQKGDILPGTFMERE